MIGISVVAGLVFSVLFTGLGLVAGRVARDFAVHSYPPAIRERYGPKSARGVRVTRVVLVVIGILLAATLTGCLLAVRSVTGPLDFLTAFLSAEVALLTFNVYDLVVLDWIVFCAWRPAVIVLPGTEGMPEYRDWRFHAVGFLRGIVICTVLALVTAVVAVTVEALA